MNFNLDVNAILVAMIAAGLGFVSRTLWKTVQVVERLDERTIQLDRRMERVEDHVVA